MTTGQKNMELMQTLDDAWNAQDWDTFPVFCARAFRAVATNAVIKCV